MLNEKDRSWGVQPALSIDYNWMEFSPWSQWLPSMGLEDEFLRGRVRIWRQLKEGWDGVHLWYFWLSSVRVFVFCAGFLMWWEMEKNSNGGGFWWGFFRVFLCLWEVGNGRQEGMVRVGCAGTGYEMISVAWRYSCGYGALGRICLCKGKDESRRERRDNGRVSPGEVFMGYFCLVFVWVCIALNRREEEASEGKVC